jgi:acetate---CoA ligase (ADP-forming)
VMQSPGNPHSLSALLAPQSIAVLGASGRPGRPGHQVLAAMSRFREERAIYPVTPRYREILDIPCVPRLEELPGPVDLAIIASANERIENEVIAALDCGAKSLVIFGALSPQEGRSKWMSRIAERATEAHVPLLGPDSLGYANFAARSAATWALPQVEPGGIALVSQSGTIYWEANTSDPRLGFSFTAHTGLEASLTISDLVSYALELPSTRVVGIYVETIRDADGFVSALEAATDREVPVVAMYAGRTEQSRTQMATHAGRLAGDRDALEALFRRYGVARAETPDEWWATLALLGSPRRPLAGGLAAVMDSGGGLALFLDYAEELGVSLAELEDATKAKLGTLLGPEAAGNPVDLWSSGEADLHTHTAELLSALASDRSTGAVVAFTTYGEARLAGFAPAVANACRGVARNTEKPVLAATYTSRQLFPDLMLDLAADGIPTLDGMRNALLAVRHAFAYRDFCSSPPEGHRAREWQNEFGSELVGRWRRRLASVSELTEVEALGLLSEAGFRTVPVMRADSEEAVLVAAAKLGYPVVLKTDEGISHKAERGGVYLALADPSAVRSAYADLAERLGKRVLVARMMTGIEVALGIVVRQFGPTLMVAAGGTLVELLGDRAHLLAPVSPEEVGNAIQELRIGRLLTGHYGPDSTPLKELCMTASRLAALACALEGALGEVDINPVLVNEEGCVAVDALVGALCSERRVAA